MAEVLVGRGSHADLTMQTYKLKLLTEGIQSKFGQVKTLALNWDPGTYSGLSWNLGLVYSCEINIGTLIPPKVANRQSLRSV